METIWEHSLCYSDSNAREVHGRANYGNLRTVREMADTEVKMWQVDKHVARAMFDDRADLEVKQRGLPVPTPSPLEFVDRGKAVPSRSSLGRRLAALAYRWDLVCRWFYRLGRSTPCESVST